MPASRTRSAASRSTISGPTPKRARQPLGERRRRARNRRRRPCRPRRSRPRDSPSSRVANRISTATCMWCRICQAPATSASDAQRRGCSRRAAAPRGSRPPSTLRRRGAGTSFGTRSRRSISAEARNVTASSDDRERRGQQLDQRARDAGADQRRRRLAERDLGVRFDQPLAARHLRDQHLVRRAADDVLHAAEEADGVQHLDRQRVRAMRRAVSQQRDAAARRRTR